MTDTSNKIPMESVLITGGAGFLGRYLASAMAGRGHRVTVLDNLSNQNSTFDTPLLKHPGIVAINGTVFDADLMAELVARHTLIAHLATVVGVEETISHTVATMENLVGTLNLVKSLTPAHVVLFTSSADVYGAHSMMYDRPMRETDFFVMEHGLVNRWVYPHVKALEENLVSNSPARSVVIRVFNTYGPEMDFPDPRRVIPHFVKNVLEARPLRLSGDGSQTRCFCYIDDLIRGIVQAIDLARAHEGPLSECFNLGNDDPVSIRDLAWQMVEQARALGAVGAHHAVEPNAFHYSQPFNDAWNRVPDLGHATRRFGYRPRISLDEGLRRTLSHYLGQRSVAPADGQLVGHEGKPA